MTVTSVRYQPRIARTTPQGTPRRRTIYAFAEYFPDPFKPYLDTQFAQLVSEGHALRVFAFGSWGDIGNTPMRRFRLGERTEYLPVSREGLRDSRAALSRSLVAHPTRLRAAIAAAHAPKITTRVVQAAQGMLLPDVAPDLCLIHNLTTATHLAAIGRLYPDSRVALYYHGGETAAPLDPELVRAAFARADVVFANTNYAGDHAVARGCPPDRIRILPLGFDLSQFTVRSERVYLPNGVLRLIAVGRLSPEKGFAHLIDALALVIHDGGVAVHLTIVGDGDERDALEARARAAGIDSHIRFAGVLPHASVLEELHHADALVLSSIPTPTFEENQGCVLQEAMLCRLAIIASDTGGVPESVAPAMLEWLVPPGDATAIAERIRRLANVPVAELNTLGWVSRRFAESRYDARPLTRRLLRESLL
ncbi:MAG TPA: glycosyltransferase [Gemmatimonadaceae bacterium]|nr:glycosyltransferase [Gemmatimonadaceae bacterium]